MTFSENMPTPHADGQRDDEYFKEHFSQSIVGSDQTLRDSIEMALNNYFANLDGQMVSDVYALVLSEMEPPLLEATLRYTRNNQCKASSVLGINRGTLRKKLKQYQLL
jgi:Fis family transcriptional regulator